MLKYAAVLALILGIAVSAATADTRFSSSRPVGVAPEPPAA